ncbi:ATP-dependent DNA helicase DDX11, partial [Elysia marginata]
IVKSHSQLSQYELKFRTRLKAKNLLYVRQILFVLGKLAALVGGKVDYTADSQLNAKS